MNTSNPTHGFNDACMNHLGRREEFGSLMLIVLFEMRK